MSVSIQQPIYLRIAELFYDNLRYRSDPQWLESLDVRSYKNDVNDA